MAVTKLDPGLIDSADLHWDDIPAGATVWVTLPAGRVVQVTMGRLQELFNAGVPGGGSDTVETLTGGRIDLDIETQFLAGGVIDGPQATVKLRGGVIS